MPFFSFGATSLILKHILSVNRKACRANGPCRREPSSLSLYLHKTFDFTNNLNIIIYHFSKDPSFVQQKIATPSQDSHKNLRDKKTV